MLIFSYVRFLKLNKNNQIIKEHVNGLAVLKYLYDQDEKLYGFIYKNQEYYYEYNILNDIIGISNKYGQTICRYEYDAWGNIITKTGNTNILNINHICYKGYYYDVETQLFYCNSRYYNPKLCRWISLDSIEYLEPKSINGLNLYCYCMNNPIMYADPSGNFPFFILTAIIGVVIGVGITAAVDYISDQEFDLHWGWYVGAGVLGAVIGAGIGMAVSYYATGSITSSTGKVFTSLFKSTSLYRSVGLDELADLKTTGKFMQGPNSMEGKFFANSKKGAMK